MNCSPSASRFSSKSAIIVEEHIKEWGLHVDSIRLLDIELPEELKKMMSRQASAEREKRATITKAEGDKLAAVNLAEAAHTMHGQPRRHATPLAANHRRPRPQRLQHRGALPGGMAANRRRIHRVGEAEGE